MHALHALGSDQHPQEGCEGFGCRFDDAFRRRLSGVGRVDPRHRLVLDVSDAALAVGSGDGVRGGSPDSPIAFVDDPNRLVDRCRNDFDEPVARAVSRIGVGSQRDAVGADDPIASMQSGAVRGLIPFDAS